LALRPAEFNGHVHTVNKSGFPQAAAECGQEPRPLGSRCAVEEPDHRHCRLLRARRERPCRCAAESPNELPPPHSITSSARASSDGGKSRPIALAVLRFTTSSNLVGCSTGRVAGMAPRRTLAICRANCAKTSVKRGP